MNYKLHLVPVVHQTLLDVLQPVRLLPNMHQFAERDWASLQQPDDALAAGLPIRPEALGFRVYAIAGDHITVGLHVGDSLTRHAVPCRDRKRLPRVDVGPAQLGPLPGVSCVRGDQVEVLGIDAWRMPERGDVRADEGTSATWGEHVTDDEYNQDPG